MSNGIRRGTWMQTYTGRKFWPADPRPEEIHVADIAHALAHIVRFNGHTRTFYTVAQHSVLVAQYVHDEYPGDCRMELAALLHDAEEAYMGDITKPMQACLSTRAQDELRSMQLSLRRAIFWRFGILDQFPLAPEVHEGDMVLLWTEKRDVLNGNHKWDLSRPYEPREQIILPWHHDRAELEFINAFQRLHVAIHKLGD